MYVAYANLVDMIRSAYDDGLHGSLDQKDQDIDTIISGVKIGPSRELRVWSVEELKRFVVGSEFHHSFLGKGKISTKKGVKGSFMTFDNGAIIAFTTDTFPWNIPMSLIRDAGEK